MPVWLQWTMATIFLLCGLTAMVMIDKPERTLSTRGRVVCVVINIAIGIIGLVYLIGGGK